MGTADVAAPPSSSAPPVAPRHEAPILSATAPVKDILVAASFGLVGLILGLVPLASMLVAVNLLRAQIPDAASLPLSIAGVLFSGMCAGYAAAWRLRPHGIRGRRVAGQLSILFMEAVVLLVLLAPMGLDRAPDECEPFCFSGTSAIGAIAIVGWPVSAVGALLGSHLFVRRLWDRGIGVPSTDSVQDTD